MADPWTPHPGVPTSPPPPGPPVPPPGPPVPPAAAYPPAAPGSPVSSGPTYPPAPPGTARLARAAHRPGAMPLRPLGLSDIYDAAFRIIRHNPAATAGAAVVVTAAAMLVPLAVTVLLTQTTSLTFEAAGDVSFSDQQVGALLGSLGSLALGLVLQWVGSLLVTGLIVQVVLAAALGRTLTLAEAWAATRGARWRLVLMVLVTAAIYLVPLVVYAALWVTVAIAADTAVVVAWGVLTVPTYVGLTVWLHTRVVQLAVPALMVERTSVAGALARAFRLSRRQFWRIFGVALLTAILTAIAAQVLTTPIVLLLQLLLTGLGPQYALLGLVLAQALSSVVAAAFVTPFTAAVSSLQYLDQRMRKEAFDVELMQRAGITGR